MAQGFRRRGKGDAARFTARLERSERDLLLSVLTQTHDLLDPPPVVADSQDVFTALTASLGGLAGNNTPHHVADPLARRDPALQRLLPPAHRDDAGAASEFRRLTESGLRRRKADAIEVARAALEGSQDVLVLDRATATALLVSLTDVRLVLGSRLGLTDDDDLERLEQALAQTTDNHPAVQLMVVYDFLTWLQETLAHALLPGVR